MQFTCVQAYLRDGWNTLDFVIVVVSLVDLAGSDLGYRTFWEYSWNLCTLIQLRSAEAALIRTPHTHTHTDTHTHVCSSSRRTHTTHTRTHISSASQVRQGVCTPHTHAHISSACRFVKAIRAVRSLRPLRLVSHWKGLQVAPCTLMRAHRTAHTRTVYACNTTAHMHSCTHVHAQYVASNASTYEHTHHVHAQYIVDCLLASLPALLHVFLVQGLLYLVSVCPVFAQCLPCV